MGSLNRVTIMGRLGADVELKSAGTTSVCNLSIATNEAWTDKGGTKQEKTEWHRATCWGKTAEIAAKYLAKGKEVLIEGRLQTREYEKDGVKRYATEIVVSNLVFVGGGQKDSGSQVPKGDWGTESQAQPKGADDDVPF